MNTLPEPKRIEEASREICTVFDGGMDGDYELEVVVSTRQVKEQKEFKSVIHRQTRQPQDGYYLLRFTLSDPMIVIDRVPCPRFSRKGLEAAHAAALADLMDRLESGSPKARRFFDLLSGGEQS